MCCRSYLLSNYMLHVCSFFFLLFLNCFPIICAGHCRNPQTESLLQFLELPYLLDTVVETNTPTRTTKFVDSTGIFFVRISSVHNFYFLHHVCVVYICIMISPSQFSYKHERHANTQDTRNYTCNCTRTWIGC